MNFLPHRSGRERVGNHDPSGDLPIFSTPALGKSGTGSAGASVGFTQYSFSAPLPGWKSYSPFFKI